MKKYLFSISAIILVVVLSFNISALSSKGEQKTIIILVNFDNANVACSIPGVNNMVFNESNPRSITNYYKNASLNNVWFTGDVVGPITIPYARDTSTSCAYSTWSSAADNIVQSSGIDLSPYTRRVYSFPTACGYGGIGEYPTSASFTRAWTFYCNGKGNLVHEFGHNFNMRHASTPTSTYGDTSDPMGSGWGPSGSNYDWLVTLNGAHYNQMTSVPWFPSNKVITINSGTVGTYNIAPLEYTPSQTSLPQVIRIPKTDTNESYYISYRRAIGFDSNLTTTYKDKLNIHRVGSGNTYFLSSLVDGGIFADSTNKITINSLSHTLDSYSVMINFSGPAIPVCVSQPPSVIISPTNQTGSNGASLIYSVSVKNNDNSVCTSKTINLNSLGPTGWILSLSSSSLLLNPGQTSSVTYTVKSSVDALVGNYIIGVNADNSGLIGTGNANYNVVQDLISPTAPTNLNAVNSGRGKKVKVSLSWTGSTDNIGVAGYQIYRNGNTSPLAVVSGSSLSYVDSSVSRGNTYNYFVKAVDAGGNISPASNVATISL